MEGHNFTLMYISHLQPLCMNWNVYQTLSYHQAFFFFIPRQEKGQQKKKKERTPDRRLTKPIQDTEEI